MNAAQRLAVTLGRVHLKNPVICGSGEHTITDAGMRAALAAGAGAVVAKSTSESAAAKRQLDGADYLLLDSARRRLPWRFDPPADAMVLCRSGLLQSDFAPWLERLAKLDREAREMDAFIVPSLILADLDAARSMARQIEQAGLRALEFNIGAPHGDEAARGAIVQERAADRVRGLVAAMRDATALPLWVKLTGQSEDVAGLAAAARDGGADAVIMMGRFMALVPDVETRRPMLGTSAAIGGPWTLALTCRWRALSRRRLGPDFPLIGTNGARDGLDVARFLLAGASAVEMTSAVLAGGTRVLADAVATLAAWLERQGVTVPEIVGEAADHLEGYGEQAPRPGHWRNSVPPECRED